MMDARQSHTDRITLVPATAAHAPLLHRIFHGAATQRYSPVGNVSVGELARNLPTVARHLAERAPSYRYFGEVDSNLFGTVVFKGIDWDAGTAEIGFSLLENYQGRGFGTALVRESVDFAFTRMGLRTLWATVSVSNQPCRRLLARLGFTDSGPYPESFRIQGRLVTQILYTVTRT